MPAGAVYCGRPTIYGNPFFGGDKLQNVALYRQLISNSPSLAAKIRELRGKDLACWCRLGEPCHVDILLELANE